MPSEAFPPPHALFLEASLYQQFAIDGLDEHWAAIDFLFFDGTYDSYCPECKRESTFKVIPPSRSDQLKRNRGREIALKTMGHEPDITCIPSGVHQLQSQCARQQSHIQTFIFLVRQFYTFDEGKAPALGSNIQKIGQHPSFADLYLAEVKKYAGVLTKARQGEFSRAIGLASHDVGIGAYVYLRRIFESLIDEAQERASESAGWDNNQYQRARMSERIVLLKDFLPAFLVEHPQVYSLLSKGIHELSEQECLSHFETLRVGIELMLDEKLQKKERELKTAAARASISKALGGTGA